MDPIQLAALTRSGKFAATPASPRRSRNVMPAPIEMLSAPVLMKRNSRIPRGSPASVRQAAQLHGPHQLSATGDGVHSPGAPASKSNTAARLPGATISCASGLPRMDGLVARLIAGRSGDYRVEDADKTRAATEIPANPSRISAMVGCGLIESNCVAAISIPGVQIPHCAPPHCRNACCSGCSDPLVASPSTV